MKLPSRAGGATSRRGLTVLELVLTTALIAIVLHRIVTVVAVTAERTHENTAEIVLEERAQLALERIARSVMGAWRDSLDPGASAPLADTHLRFQVNLGIEDGEVVWSDMEEIGLDEQRGEIHWAIRPGTAQEEQAVWVRTVADFLEDEVPNGMDDNGNGLVDERGLAFSLEGNALSIRLSLARPGEDGGLEFSTVETVVAVRNRPEVSE